MSPYLHTDEINDKYLYKFQGLNLNKTLPFAEDQVQIIQYEDELQEVVFELNEGRTQYDILFYLLLCGDAEIL